MVYEQTEDMPKKKKQRQKQGAFPGNLGKGVGIAARRWCLSGPFHSYYTLSEEEWLWSPPSGKPSVQDVRASI